MAVNNVDKELVQNVRKLGYDVGTSRDDLEKVEYLGAVNINGKARYLLGINLNDEDPGLGTLNDRLRSISRTGDGENVDGNGLERLRQNLPDVVANVPDIWPPRPSKVAPATARFLENLNNFAERFGVNLSEDTPLVIEAAVNEGLNAQKITSISFVPATHKLKGFEDFWNAIKGVSTPGDDEKNPHSTIDAGGIALLQQQLPAMLEALGPKEKQQQPGG